MAKSKAQQAAIAISNKNKGVVPKGYHRMPDGSIMKDSAHKMKKGGSTPAWTRKEGKSPSGGLNAKGRASLKAAGHDIKAPQPEGGPRKRSFCARMSGMKKKLTSAKTANDPNSRINKSLRKSKC